MRGLKKNSFSQKILIKLGELLEITGYILFWDYKELRKISGFGPLYRDVWKYPPPKSSPIPKYLNSLKRGNFIKETKTKKGRKIELTKKGWREVIKYKIKLSLKKRKWNKKWFAVAWDIPEISRKDRDYLRGILKWIGFKELQKSLWIFPFNVRKELTELFKFYKEKLLGDVRFLIIEKIEDDSDFKKYFNLN